MITITDIAARAGVARSTVSYVLNERNTSVRISDETRERVTAAARDLGYRRNELARAMTTGKNAVLGFWVMDARREPDVRVLAGAMKEAEANNHFIKMLSLDSSGDASQIADHCIDWRLGGIIAINASCEALDQVLPQVARFNIPLVMVEGERARPDCLHVTSDQESGIREAVRHLAELGHRRIAYLGGTPGANIRERAYLAAMEELQLSEFAEVTYSNWDAGDVQRAAAALVNRDRADRPTAVCCVCDHSAMMLISSVGKLGLRVPQDLAVTGYDDLAVAAMYNPPLTTISQPFEEMGRVAVRRLLGLIDKSARTDQMEISLPTYLVVRDSAARLSSARQHRHSEGVLPTAGRPLDCEAIDWAGEAPRPEPRRSARGIRAPVAERARSELSRNELSQSAAVTRLCES